MPVELPWKDHDWETPKEYPTKEEFLAGRKRRYGTSNPEVIKDPFMEFMVRTRDEPFFLRERYGFGASGYCSTSAEKDETAIWSFLRIGGSTTLYEGRYRVHIGGEHDDWYDPDFLIYNDVIVEDDKSNVWIYSYPRDVLPPIDFHTATLLETSHRLSLPCDFGESILIIGGLGYVADREFWRTPVYLLRLWEMSIKLLETSGDEPGWIYAHHAVLKDDGSVLVVDGEVLDENGKFQKNERMFSLNLWDMKWTVIG